MPNRKLKKQAPKTGKWVRATRAVVIETRRVTPEDGPVVCPAHEYVALWNAGYIVDVDPPASEEGSTTEVSEEGGTEAHSPSEAEVEEPSTSVEDGPPVWEMSMLPDVYLQRFPDSKNAPLARRVLEYQEEQAAAEAAEADEAEVTDGDDPEIDSESDVAEEEASADGGGEDAAAEG